MEKFNLSKKTLKNKILVAILFHTFKIDMKYLLGRLVLENEGKILIILDDIDKKKFIEKYKKFKKFITIIESKRKNNISYSRNIAIKYAITNNFKLLLYIDSDAKPIDNIVSRHLKLHKIYKKFEILSGAVQPTFMIEKTGLFCKIDGLLSWFGSIESEKNYEVFFPYHVPTLNMSIKINFLKKNNLFFNEYLSTGEDYQFCNDLKKLGGKILKITFCRVRHKDRKKLTEVINHQKKWGQHQYHTLFKPHLNNMIKKFLFVIFFLPSIPIISLLICIISLYPWIKYKFSFIKFFLLVYIFCILKNFYTYKEGIKRIIKSN